jgi:predicted nucleotidyltransferase
MPSTSEADTLPSWIDKETRALIKDMVDLLVDQHADILAIILYGSVARHEDRSLYEPDPSDVDLLAVLNTDNPHIPLQKRIAFFSTLNLAHLRHLDAPREVQFMLASRTLGEWDPTFIANVKRDGIVLYQRGELPAPLAA